jgi:circadian clock protein KaiC
MVSDERATRLPRCATGLRGFDEISHGGLPAASSTLVTGSVGSGKTVFALQFLAEGIRQHGEAGVFVTFGEPAEKMRRFVVEFGWDVPGWEAGGHWTFVDATPGVEDGAVIVGERYDLSVLLHRIASAVRRTGATRVAIDSIGVLLARFADVEAVRDVIIRTTAELDRLGVTTVLTLSRDDERESVAIGIEEMVVDNLILLRNASVDETRRRTVEVLKLRGTSHRQGCFPFVISGEHGMVVIPLAVRLDQPAMSQRIASGIDGFDEMT